MCSNWIRCITDNPQHTHLGCQFHFLVHFFILLVNLKPGIVAAINDGVLVNRKHTHSNQSKSGKDWTFERLNNDFMKFWFLEIEKVRDSFFIPSVIDQCHQLQWNCVIINSYKKNLLENEFPNCIHSNSSTHSNHVQLLWLHTRHLHTNQSHPQQIWTEFLEKKKLSDEFFKEEVWNIRQIPLSVVMLKTIIGICEGIECIPWPRKTS